MMSKDQMKVSKTEPAAEKQPAESMAERDIAHLTAEVRAAREAESHQIAAASRLRARVFDLTDKLLAMSGGETADGHAAVVKEAMQDLRAELDDLTAQVERQRDAAAQARELVAARESELKRAILNVQTKAEQIAAQNDRLEKAKAVAEALKQAEARIEAIAAERDKVAAQRDDMAAKSEKITAERDAERKAVAAERDAERNAIAAERDAERDAIAAERDAIAAERDELLQRDANHELRLAARETALSRMADDLQKLRQSRDEAQALANQRVDEIKALTAMLEQRLKELETARANAAKARELAEARQVQINERQAQINALHASTSWRITRPLRALRSSLSSRRAD